MVLDIFYFIVKLDMFNLVNLISDNLMDCVRSASNTSIMTLILHIAISLRLFGIYNNYHQVS